MTIKNPKTSRILDAVHQTARDLEAAGVVSKRRMKDYDTLCLAFAQASPPAGSEGMGGRDLSGLLSLVGSPKSGDDPGDQAPRAGTARRFIARIASFKVPRSACRAASTLASVSKVGIFRPLS